MVLHLNRGFRLICLHAHRDPIYNDTDAGAVPSYVSIVMHMTFHQVELGALAGRQADRRTRHRWPVGVFGLKCRVTRAALRAGGAGAKLREKNVGSASTSRATPRPVGL